MKKKLNEVTKQRIWLYGSIFVMLLLISVFIKVYNYRAVQIHGVALTTDLTIAQAAEAGEAFALYPDGYGQRLLFQSSDVEAHLRKGLTVIVDAAQGTEAPELYVIVGADGAGFTAYDASGAPAQLPARVYKSYFQNP